MGEVHPFYCSERLPEKLQCEQKRDFVRDGGGVGEKHGLTRCSRELGHWHGGQKPGSIRVLHCVNEVDLALVITVT